MVKKKKDKTKTKKHKSKNNIERIKEIKSEIKEIKESKPEEESSLEESIDENEQQIRNIGFQKFIQTGSAVKSSPVLSDVTSASPASSQSSQLESEPLEIDLESDRGPSGRGQDEESSESTIEQYAVPEPSMEQYREIVREQARMSSEVSPIQANQGVDFETIGRQQERIGAEAGMVNAEELMGMGAGSAGARAGMPEEYDIVNPEKVGFERAKDTRPFQEDNLKKSYDERV
ncbi:hypothetical protein GF378_02575 [Candidatus Pacearchaeota archaeon]|nr:hypothetical protein [Candidatus Pacearchaeota archaeon]